MKVLVTGATGFIGRHVVPALSDRGHAVRVLTRAPASPAGANGLEVFHADLRQDVDLRPALAGVDAVVHCAAAMSGSLEEQRVLTVEGTRRLMFAAKEARVRRVVGVSTFALYDYLGIPAGSVLDELSPLAGGDGRSPYAIAKREQEDLIRESGVGWTMFRPGIVFGRGRAWSYHLGVMIGGGLWLSNAGDSVLPLTYVENCAEAMALAVDSEAAQGATVNVVDDDLPTRRGYLEALARRMDPRPRIFDLPWKLLDPLARVATWTDHTLLFDKAPLPGLLRRDALHARCKPLRYSNRVAHEVLGWRPRHDLAAALERTFAS